MRNPFNNSNPFTEKQSTRKNNRAKREKPAYKGISRIDSDHNHTHGWYVRVRKDGKVTSKFFSDRKYGGVAKALMKARRHYKKEMQELIAQQLGETPRHLPNRVIVTKNKNNNTGVIGVQKIVRENPGGSIYRAFRVCWTDQDNKPRTKFFSIDKFGEKDAFRKACAYRKARLLED